MMTENRPQSAKQTQINSALARVSTRFAAELRVLSRSIKRRDNIDRQLRVLREYARTWEALAAEAQGGAR